MTYDWTDYKDEVEDVYLRQGKTLDQLMKHMADVHGFAPGKRTFQAQLKRWNMTSKGHRDEDNPALLQRVKELWEQNVPQKQMLEILDSEGLPISSRGLIELRKKSNLYLRNMGGYKGRPQHLTIDEDDNSLESHSRVTGSLNGPQVTNGPLVEPTPPEVIAERKEQLKKVHSEKWVSKTRRRHTKSFAGLPPDPAGTAPRYPSETTITEAKNFLQLDKKKYDKLREEFSALCAVDGIVKKTAAGREKWAELKRALVSANAHLSAMFAEGSPKLDSKEIALDVICTEVTKRHRMVQGIINIKDAKINLGLNPMDAQKLRMDFYRILQGSHFNTKREMGKEKFEQLKSLWISNHPILYNIARKSPQEAAQDPQHDVKMRSINVLARDVTKRYRDDRNSEADQYKAASTLTPATGNPEVANQASTPQIFDSNLQKDCLGTSEQGNDLTGQTAQAENNFASPDWDIAWGDRPRYTAAIAQPPQQVNSKSRKPRSSNRKNKDSAADSEQFYLNNDSEQFYQVERPDNSTTYPQIDPALFLAAYQGAQIPPVAPAQAMDKTAKSASSTSTSPASSLENPPSVAARTAQPTVRHLVKTSMTRTIPAFFWLDPSSQIQKPPKVWLVPIPAEEETSEHDDGAISIDIKVTIDAVRTAAVQKHPNTTVVKLQGKVAEASPFPIDNDDELKAYIECVIGTKVSFLVALQQNGF